MCGSLQGDAFKDCLFPKVGSEVLPFHLHLNEIGIYPLMDIWYFNWKNPSEQGKQHELEESSYYKSF